MSPREPMDQESGGGFGLDRLRAAWSRRKWLAITLFVLPLTAGVTLVMSLPDVYRSSATVLIERQQVPEEYVRSTVTSELETRLTSMSQDVLSRSRLEPLIKELDLYAALRRGESTGPRMEAAVGRMRGEVRLELRESTSGGPRRQTIAFAISYRGRNPETVALATNALASSYVEENLKVREQQASATTEFIRVQLAEARRRLDEQERKSSELKGQYLGELPQQAQANFVRLESMNSQLRLNHDNQVRLMERRDTLATQLAESRTESGVEPDEVRLQRLKGELANLRIKYTDLWPDIVRLKDEIASLEKTLAQPKPKKPVEDVAPTPQMQRLQEALRSADTELALLKTEERRLRNDSNALQVKIDNAPKREQEFADLTRDHDSTKEVYLSLLKRYEEAQLSETMEQRQKGEQFKLVEPAVASYTPVAPNRPRLLGIVLALSVALAVGVVALAEIIDTSFHSVDDLRSFSALPVLVAIPRIMTEPDIRRRRSRFRLAAAAVLVGLALIGGGAYWVAAGNESLTSMLSPSKGRS
ncbi:MAG: XrtA system polysaccharide chain length determinant [Candidatus Rokuibacteriota bacterium]